MGFQLLFWAPSVISNNRTISHFVLSFPVRNVKTVLYLKVSSIFLPTFIMFLPLIVTATVSTTQVLGPFHSTTALMKAPRPYPLAYHLIIVMKGCPYFPLGPQTWCLLGVNLIGNPGSTFVTSFSLNYSVVL